MQLRGKRGQIHGGRPEPTLLSFVLGTGRRINGNLEISETRQSGKVTTVRQYRKATFQK